MKKGYMVNPVPIYGPGQDKSIFDSQKIAHLAGIDKDHAEAVSSLTCNMGRVALG